MRDKNPIIKKTTIPFKDLRSLRVPYAGNCAPDHEKLDVRGNCNCDCDCDCHCDCYYAQDCACDCEQSFCDCNCVCDCGGWVKEGTLLIPEGTKKIQPHTYRQRGQIREVILPSGLEVIGSLAFYLCQSLHTVNFPEGLLEIEESAFCSTALKEVVLPDSVTRLGGSAFNSCKNLKRVRIGRGLKELSMCGVFCNSLAIESFVVDEENPYFKAVDGALLSKDGKTFYVYPAGKKEEEYVLPDGVETVATYAFAKNQHLKKVFLPDGLKTVRAYAFSDTAVEEFSFPKSINYVEDRGFAGCNKLWKIRFRGKRSEYHLKTDSSWAFSINGKGEQPNVYTEDGYCWGV